MTQNVSIKYEPWQTAFLDEPRTGQRVRFAFARPKNLAPERAILVLNGRSEWIEKYAFLPGAIFAHQPVLWISLDHLGQGDSSGQRAYIDDYAIYASSVLAVIMQLAPELEYSIICHSMGGLIALYGVLHDILRPRSMALCSPLLRLPNQPVPRILAKPIARLFKMAKLGHLSTGAGANRRLDFVDNPLTTDISGFNRIIESPFAFVAPTFAWLDASFRACDEIFSSKLLVGLKTPVLIVGGKDERVVDPGAWSDWSQLAGQVSKASIKYVQLQSGRHELLNESKSVRRQVLSLIENWLSIDTAR